jgi:hypothetical protein
MVLVCYSQGSLRELLWTAFSYPPQALSYAPAASETRIVTAAAFFMKVFAPWTPFMLAAVALWIFRQRDLLTGLLLMWVLVGIGLFLLQRFSWWHYHTLLVLCPAGLLAVLGIDRVAAWLSDREKPEDRLRLGAAVAGIVALTATATLAYPMLTKAQPLLSSLFVTGKGLRAYQMHPRVSEHYWRLWRGAQFLKGQEAAPGPIYVFGNAMVYDFSGRMPAHPANGSSWQFYLPEQIDDILHSLQRQQVSYILVDQTEDYLFRLRPKITAFLADNYVVDHRDSSGTWFRWQDVAADDD